MIKKFVIIGIVLCAFVLLSTSCRAQNNAEDYAPILYFESEETCHPIDAEFQITYSSLYNVGNAAPISTTPSASELSSYSADTYQYYYLDNQDGSPASHDKIISDSKSWESTNGNTVYYRSYIDSTTGTNVIQYWFYYAFNDGELNKHEGDWEMVEIAIDGSRPSWVAFSQHYSGQWAAWDQVEKEGNHFKVYVARGSHANYLRSYSGKLGVASDIVGANGKILKNANYKLKDLDDSNQSWVNFRGRWGECGADSNKFASYEALGNNGPNGPKFREDGSMWNNPVSWGKGLSQANDLMFTAEWFVYNFVLIFILITLASLGLMAFLIYRRHKKYGLGPRIVSMFYIDGFNLKSIGNILCIVGIILAIIGLFYTWYAISVDMSALSVLTGITTSGLEEIITIHGINGIQMSIPGNDGFTPVATLAIPFSLFIGIALLFLIIATIGISHSRKLGWKYIWRGVRLIIPAILILIVIMAIGSIVPQGSSNDVASSTMSNILKSISSSPFGSEKTFYIAHENVNVPITMRWGLGLGAQLLLVSSIIIIIAGVLEIISNTQLFAIKKPMGTPKSMMPSQQPSTAQSKTEFCTECGAKLKENSTFCTECGKKSK